MSRYPVLVGIFSILLVLGPGAWAQGPPPAVVLQAHPLSACFSECGGGFERCVASGRGIGECGGEVASCAERVCPRVDFSGLSMSGEARVCQERFVACAAPAGECRRDLLVCVGGTPEARAYRMQRVSMAMPSLSNLSGNAPVAVESEGRRVADLRVRREDGRVVGATLNAAWVRSNFSSADPRVGQTGVKVDADLSGVPAGGRLEMAPMVDPGVAERLRGVLSTLRLRDLAFSVDIQSDLPVVSARLNFKVDRAWADAQPAGSIRVIREFSGGGVDALATRFDGYDGRLASYTADSTGFSVFSLAAVEPIEGPRLSPSAPPAVTPRQPGFEAALGVAALLLAALWGFRRIL